MTKTLAISFFFFWPLLVLAQAGLRLQVTDEEGKTMPGVTVRDLDFQFNSVSDQRGYVDFPSLADDIILHFEFLGYQTIELAFVDLPRDPAILRMTPSPELLDEVIVLGRTDDIASNLGYQVEFISRDRMRLVQSQNTADALADNAMVFVQKSQMGGGSPIIRGFEANQVLLVVDGTRLNNAIYRSGHLQNAITIDHSALERMEVIYGPGSLIYGSDALGGVIHFRTEQPNFIPSGKECDLSISGEYGFKYSSANEEKSTNLRLTAAGKRWTSYTAFSHSDFGDLRAGSVRNHDFKDFGKRSTYVDAQTDEIRINEEDDLQLGTAYDQTNLIQKFNFKLSDRLKLRSNFQYSTSSDIPRYDQLSIVDGEGNYEFSEWNYGPQKRVLLSLRADFQSRGKLYDSGSMIVAFQRIDEDRISRSFGHSLRNYMLEDVRVWNANLDFKKSLGGSDRMFLRYGAEYFTNDVGSEAFSEDKDTGARSYDILTRYPSGGSQWSGGGIYAVWNAGWLNDRLRLEAGARYSFFRADVRYNSTDVFVWPQYFYDGIRQNNDALTLAGGIRYNFTSDWKFRVYGGTAFRSPNIDDFAKVRVKNDKISVPNPQLDPVKTINLEASLGKSIPLNLSWWQSLETGLTAYHTWIRDAIIRTGYTMPNGDSTYFFQGEPYQVQANVNAQEGWIRGISLSLEAVFTDRISAEASYNFQKGRSIHEGVETPLAHIPPAYGKAGLRYQDKRLEFSLIMRFNGEKSLSEYAPEGSSDNLEYATPEGTPSWISWNTYARYKFHPLLSLHVSVENMGDLHYRPFSSGVSAAGRNFKIGISGSF